MVKPQSEKAFDKKLNGQSSHANRSFLLPPAPQSVRIASGSSQRARNCSSKQANFAANSDLTGPDR